MTVGYGRKTTRESFSEEVAFETWRMKGYISIYMAEAHVDFRLDLYSGHSLEATDKNPQQMKITRKECVGIGWSFSYAKFNPFWVSVTHWYFQQHFTDHVLFPRLPTWTWAEEGTFPLFQSCWLSSVSMLMWILQLEDPSVHWGPWAGLWGGGWVRQQVTLIGIWRRKKAVSLLSCSHLRERTTTEAETPRPPCSMFESLVMKMKMCHSVLRVLETILCII